MKEQNDNVVVVHAGQAPPLNTLVSSFLSLPFLPFVAVFVVVVSKEICAICEICG
jgi:hypothetical protein